MFSNFAILVWKNLSREEITQILKIGRDISLGLLDQTYLKSYIGRVFQIISSKSKKDIILLDLYYYVIRYSLDQDYSPEQISVLMSIFQQIYYLTISTPFDNKPEVKAFLNQLLMVHSISHKPFSIALFSITQNIDIFKYFSLTYFAHFDMYKYIFTSKPVLELVLLNITTPQNLANIETKDQPEKICTNPHAQQTLLYERNLPQEIDIKNMALIASDDSNIIKFFSSEMKAKMIDVKYKFIEEIENMDDIINKKLTSLETSLQLPL